MSATAPIFGRDREIATLLELAEAGVDLVTIGGPGGVGKSLLARVAAARMAGAAGLGRVVSLDLHEAADGEEVVAAVLAALEEEAAGDDEPVRAAAAALDRADDLLVVLDGVERCVDIVRTVAAARGQGGARMLVTSQIELGLDRERVVRLGALPVPPPGATPAEVASSPAALMYADRRRRRSTAYRLEDEPTDALVLLLERVGGMPLAIELAAARARSLSTADIAARLDSTAALLTSQAPDRPPRQRSMDAAVAWSWSLLSEPARDLLGAAAVFRAPFTLAGLEAVAGAVALDALDELVSHSLLERDAEAGDTYRALDFIRAFARAQLAAQRRAELVLRHARHVVAPAPPNARSADDLRAAYDAALEAGDLALAARAGVALSSAFAWLGLMSAARAALVDAYRRAGDAIDGEAWCALAVEALSLLDDAPPFGKAGVARLRDAVSAASPAVRARAQRVLAAFHFKRGDLAGAAATGESAIAAAREAGAPLELAFSLSNQAHYLSLAGRGDEGLPLAEEAVRVARSLDLPVAHGTALSILAACQIEVGDAAGAVATLRAAVAWTRDAGWNAAAASARSSRRAGRSRCASMALLAESLLALGRLGEAEALLDDADALLAADGGVLDASRGFQGTLQLARGFLAELRGQPRAALDPLERAQQAFAVVGGGLAEAVVWTRIAWATQELGRAPAAAAALERARALAGGDAPPWLLDLLARVASHGADVPPVREVEPVAMRLARAVAAAGGAPRPARYVLSNGGRHLVGPTGARIDLGRRRAVPRILLALAAASPAALSVHELFEAAWPDQRATHESARNRVYVSLSTLRRLGAGDMVRSTEGGYRLAPGVEVVAEEE
ncbi:MAG TPA: hypothetical protein VMZ28_19150 [Kofleriaceae bacterium]|nr:hypothetical protein [Kofleriaceae bacterium]